MVKGIVRNMDSLGRIVVPMEMRRAIGLNVNDPVDIYFRNGIICMEPCRLQCVCCGSQEEEKLSEINGVHMCPECIEKFGEVKLNEHKNK